MKKVLLIFINPGTVASDVLSQDEEWLSWHTIMTREPKNIQSSKTPRKLMWKKVKTDQANEKPAASYIIIHRPGNAINIKSLANVMERNLPTCSWAPPRCSRRGWSDSSFVGLTVSFRCSNSRWSFLGILRNLLPYVGGIHIVATCSS